MVAWIIGQGVVPPGDGTRAGPWFIGIGLVLALLGLVASVNLLFATIAVTYTIGAMMFVAAIFQLIHAFAMRSWGRMAFLIVSGLLYLAAGALTIYDPRFAAGMIVLLLAAVLGGSGIARVVFALGRHKAGWGWMLASGLASILAAVIIAMGWPFNALWLLGFLLVIDLIFQGVMMIFVGVNLRLANV
ncbi:HdeD family acid-resistance protein [Sphingomonas sp. MMS24-J13]|uniref:HdeD family acid-resistance protein n=1 Tax=Sphingomonas sp. MMS24-J13 TaxID=3238686 RepID=UPI00384B63BA